MLSAPTPTLCLRSFKILTQIMAIHLLMKICGSLDPKPVNRGRTPMLHCRLPAVETAELSRMLPGQSHLRVLAYAHPSAWTLIYHTGL